MESEGVVLNKERGDKPRSFYFRTTGNHSRCAGVAVGVGVTVGSGVGVAVPPPFLNR